MLFSTNSTRFGISRRPGRLRRFWRAATRFARREDGMEALQTVMILSIAAVCLITVKVSWEWISEYFSVAMEIFLEL